MMLLTRTRRENMSKYLDRIVDYEMGMLPFEEVVELFQDLLDSGMVWKLQGSYGRNAVRLIESGHIKVKGDHHGS